jgi:hypothetical protein
VTPLKGEPHKIGKSFSHAYNAAEACMFVVGSLPDGDAFIGSIKLIFDSKKAVRG